MYKTIFVLLCALMLSACSSLQISESEINDKASEWIAKGQQISLGKSALLPKLIPEKAYFSISPEHIKLNINASMEMRSFFGRKSIASGFVTMTGVPYLNAETGKIYIKKYNIEQVEMTMPNGKAWSVKGEMFDGLKHNIVNYVEKMPIYDINKNEKLSGVILSQVKQIELKSGHLVLVM